MIREEEPPTPSTRLETTEELAAIAAKRSLEPRRLSGLVRGELDWIVMKCLEKDRGRRYETAEGLARVYAALACGGQLDGVRLVRADTLDAATERQPLANADGTADPFALGYQLLAQIYPGLGQRSFGHTGMGGFIGFADPDRRLGFGFVMNRLGSNGAAHLLAATYGAIAA